jgi:hypothetical protein
MAAETTHYANQWPKLGSLILTHDWNGEVNGSRPGRPKTARTR